MFVDYSGLQRFGTINKSFANNYLQLLSYEGLRSSSRKLEELKKTERTVPSIREITVNDAQGHVQVIDLLFKLSTSLNQMVDEFEAIKRCPTLYVVDLLDDRDASIHEQAINDSNEILRNSLKCLYSNFQMVRSALYKEIKKLILDLRPGDDLNDFEQWHVLQRCLFYEHCPNVSKFAIPKIDIVIIPFGFPKSFTTQVNDDGFINGQSKLRFLKFDLNSGASLYDIQVESLVLKPIESKISTIWKDGDEKDFIGTMWEPESPIAKSPNKSHPSFSGVPQFLNLFKDVFPETEERTNPSSCTTNNKVHHGKAASRSDSVTNRSCEASPVESESTVDSYAKGARSMYEIFSPLSGNDLLTATTPANSPSSIGNKNNIKHTRGQAQAQFQPQIHSAVSKSIPEKPKINLMSPPPPPSLLSPDYDNYSQYSKKQSLKEKFKLLLTRSAQNISQSEQKINLFDTVGSFAEFQSSTWNEMSSKKFLKFKYKKFKRDCRYYKGIARQCFQDIQGTC